MILDFSAMNAPDGDLRNWDVVDATTGELIDRVTFADDEAGVVDRHLTDARGNVYFDWNAGGVAMIREIRPIRIVPKSGSPRVTGRPWRLPADDPADSWRDRPPLL